MIYNLFNYCDAPERWQIGFQDPATPISEGMRLFHSHLIVYLIAIGLFVCFMLYAVCTWFNSLNHNKIQKFSHSSLLEIIWTILPAVILVFIAVPSFALIWSLEDPSALSMTLKIIGHQWYWSYEYSDYSEANDLKSLNYDSYMLNLDDLTRGSLRLLEVDQRVVVPTGVHVRLLVTSADVLHSWAVPSFGIKVDACPGRLSETSLFLKREGVYYGQCSEICGTNHGFMPIVVKGVEKHLFIKWAFNKLESI